MENKNTTPESSIEKRLKTEVEKRGGWCIKLSSAHITGLPDRLCLFPGGRVAFVELKKFGKKPRKIQTVVHSKLRSLGFMVEVIDTTMGCMMFASDYD